MARDFEQAAEGAFESHSAPIDTSQVSEEQRQVRVRSSGKSASSSLGETVLRVAVPLAASRTTTSSRCSADRTRTTISDSRPARSSVSEPPLSISQYEPPSLVSLQQESLCTSVYEALSSHCQSERAAVVFQLVRAVLKQSARDRSRRASSRRASRRSSFEQSESCCHQREALPFSSCEPPSSECGPRSFFQ